MNIIIIKKKIILNLFLYFIIESKIIINLVYSKNFAYNSNKKIFITLLSFILLYYLSFSLSYGLTYNSNSTKPCNCVIFRMDDIQDYWIEQGQIVPMDLFLSKNKSLSLGLIMNEIGNDSKLIDKVKEGFNKGNFELALHGWNHTDYSKLSEQEQTKSLGMAKAKLNTIFRINASIFIPPEDGFNLDTIKAMQQNDLRVLSSNMHSEGHFNGTKSILNAK